MRLLLIYSILYYVAVCLHLYLNNNANSTTIAIVYKNKYVKAVPHRAHLEIDRVCEKNNTWQ